MYRVNEVSGGFIDLFVVGETRHGKGVVEMVPVVIV